MTHALTRPASDHSDARRGSLKIVVMGLGYVGFVSAVCLANDGRCVTGVDRSDALVQAIRQGVSPVFEAGASERLRRALADGTLRLEVDGTDAIADADLCMVCVGTPSGLDGGVDLTAVTMAIRQIAKASRRRTRPVTVVVRSTIQPGTTETVLLRAWEEQGADPDMVAFLCHPEFIREGAAFADYYEPAMIVVGEATEGSAPGDALMSLYTHIAAPRVRTDWKTAELVKYACNAFHAVKIAFANEMGGLAAAYGVDGRALMKSLCLDRKLNVSDAYLAPGFAFGGSCLPKDARALLHMAQKADRQLPLIAGAMAGNDALIDAAVRLVIARGAASVGMWGLAFKPETDDLRESPYVELARRLIRAGCVVNAFDPLVSDGVPSLRNAEQLALVEGLRLVTDAEDLLPCDLMLLAHLPPDTQINRWRSAGVALVNLATDIL